MIVIHGSLGIDVRVAKLDTSLEGGQFLWFEVLVCLVTTYRIEQFRHGWHAQRGVIRGIELKGITDAVAHIYPWIHTHVHVCLTIFHGNQARRKGKPIEQHVVFKYKLRIGALQSVGVLTVSAMNGLWVFEFLSKVSTHQVFVSQLSTEGCSTSNPIKVGIQIDTIHVGSVVVERIFVRLSTKQLKPIHASVPINRRAKMEFTLFIFGLYGCERLESMLKLIVPFHAIERV